MAIPYSLSGWLIFFAITNLFCVWLTGIPAIYCVGVHLLSPLAPWVSMVRIMMCVGVVLAFMWDYWNPAIKVLTVWLAFEIVPVVLTVVFLGVGHSCGLGGLVPTIAKSVPLTKMEWPSEPVKATVVVPVKTPTVSKPETVEHLRGAVIGYYPKEERPAKPAAPKMTERERGLLNRELY